MEKIFIAAPLTYNFDTGFVESIREWIRDFGYQPIVPHDFASVTPEGDQMTKEISSNFVLLDGSDIILADVTKPSHGVGMEILHAHNAGKKVILIAKQGTLISAMARAFAHNIVEYEDADDLRIKLSGLLNGHNTSVS